jgi:hypothetical protein
VLAAQDNQVGLFHRVADPDHDGLFFIGLVQPLGAIMPLAEAQAHWVADLLAGTAALPSRAAMRREIEAYRRRTAARYVASSRHTIQVDFMPYLRELARERRRGARRHRRGLHGRRGQRGGPAGPVDAARASEPARAAEVPDAVRATDPPGPKEAATAVEGGTQ